MNYHNLTYPDMNNGEGLRVVLWLSGCSHKCRGCQNPQTWDVDSGISFDEAAKQELFRELGKDYISGLTLSGGDPLYEKNLDDVLDLINEIRLSLPQKSIWLYTGYTWESVINHQSVVAGKIDYIEDGYIDGGYEKRKKIISQCDVLIDGQYIDSKRDITLPYRGSKNQRIIDVKRSLQEGEVIPWTV